MKQYRYKNLYCFFAFFFALITNVVFFHSHNELFMSYSCLKKIMLLKSVINHKK